LTSLVVFAAAVVTVLAATPVARRVARHAGITDAPAAHKPHAHPTPLLGGLGIYAAVVLALVLFGDRYAAPQLAGIVAGATWMSLLGVWDDRRPMRPRMKLAGQLGGAVVLLASGVHTQLLGGPALAAGLGQARLGLADAVLTIVWILAVTNAINFMDNMDGVLSGVAAAAAAAYLLLASANDQVLVAPLAAALLGASLGFLVYNFNPATIFMGDGGSLFLGYILAALGLKLRFPDQSTEATWMIPGIVLAVPLFDLALVVVSRARRGVNPFTTGGRDHLSHRLVCRGATPREAALTIWLLSCAAGGAAIFVDHADRRAAWLMLTGLVGVGLAGIWALEWAARPAAVARPLVAEGTGAGAGLGGATESPDSY